MPSLCAVVLGILELGSPFILMNSGFAFHNTLLLTLAALLGQCTPRPFRYSRKVLLLLNTVSLFLLFFLHSGSTGIVRIAVLFYSVFTCSASMSSYIRESGSLPDKERRIMKIIGYALSGAIALSPHFIFVLSYVLAFLSAYRYTGDTCGSDNFPENKKAFFTRNIGFLAEGMFSYVLVPVICLRAATMFSNSLSSSYIFSLFSMLSKEGIFVFFLSEIFVSLVFALYKASSNFGVIPFSATEGKSRRLMVCALLALSLFVQLKNITAAGSALVFILSGFLFKEYAPEKSFEETTGKTGEKTYFREIGLAVSIILLLLTEGNFFLVIGVSVFTVLLSILFIGKNFEENY